MAQIVYGVTGTREGATRAQMASFLARFWQITVALEARAHEKWFVHGGCKGVDVQCHEILRPWGWKFWVLPGPDGPHQTCPPADVVEEPRPYLERNRLIVDRAHALQVIPKDFQEVLRSGTWATQRYAADVGRKMGIIWPDGRCQDWKGGGWT